MKHLKLKNIILICLVIFLSFSWGFLTIYKQIFPYNVLKPSNEMTYKAPESAELDKYWVDKLSEGGYIIHFRHAQREKWNDVTAFDAWELANNIKAEDSSFSKAVCLTDQGVEEAKLIGNVFRKANVNISKVISSPSCRARQTAVLAFGKIDQISNSLLHRTANTPNQFLPMTKKLREIILNTKLEDGKNIILSGHGGTISNNIDYLIDVNNVGVLDDRDETGLIILRKENDKIIAEYKFKSINFFANSFIEFEVN
jgi:broad specificity phosphatase PhoE